MPLQSVYLNGGFIGVTTSYQRASTGFATLQYVGGATQGYLGTTSNITFSLTSLTGGLASAPAEGDLVIVCFATNPDDTGQISYRISGYTELANLYAIDTDRAQLQVGYKIMTSSPDTSVTITGGTADIDQAGAIAVHVWRNVDSSTPFDVTSTTVQETNTVLADPPSITPITSGAVIVAAGAGGHLEGLDTYSSSDLSNFLTSGGNDTHDVTIGLGSSSWTSGPFDPAQFTFSDTDSTAYAACAITMALRPATISIPSNDGIFNLQAVLESLST